jgi:hypothetical protein
MSMKKGNHVGNIYSKGLVIHACLAITTERLPLGLLDQNIFARKPRPEHERRSKGGRYIQDVLPVEEKETYRRLQALKTAEAALPGTCAVTVRDREADLYDFFKLSHQLDAAVLVRVSANRTINRKSRYAEKDVSTLWDYRLQQPVAGSYTLQLPKRARTMDEGVRQKCVRRRSERRVQMTGRSWSPQEQAVPGDGVIRREGDDGCTSKKVRGRPVRVHLLVHAEL